MVGSKMRRPAAISIAEWLFFFAGTLSYTLRHWILC
jgi:hypothetical protein